MFEIERERERERERQIERESERGGERETAIIREQQHHVRPHAE